MLFGYRLSAILFIALSLIIVSLFVFDRYKTSYETTQGTVTRVLELREDLCVYWSCITERYIVSFQTKTGQRIEAKFSSAGNNSVPRIGDKLTVEYNTNDPSGTATEYYAVRWDFVFGIFIGSIGICMLLVDWIVHRFFQMRQREKI